MIRRFRSATFLFAFAMILLASPRVFAQADTGTIKGTVTDTNAGAMPGAQITLTPTGVSVASDVHGNFVINGVAAGQYKISMSYVGFTTFEGTATVVAGEVAKVNVVLKVASVSEQVVVTSQTAHGETEAINEERTTPQILDVLLVDA